MATLDTYKELAERMAELAYLGNASTILGWDQRTYMPLGVVRNGHKLLPY